MSSEGRSASGRDGGTPSSSDRADASQVNNAERELGYRPGHAATVFNEVTPRANEANGSAREIAAIADSLARAEREAEARTRHAELVAEEAEDLKKRLADNEARLEEANALLAHERAQSALQLIKAAPLSSVTARPRIRLKKRIKALASSVFRKRPKAASIRTSLPSSDQEAMDLIARSDLFDAEWYLNKYPDIRAAGVEPLHHYFHHGGEEGRKPGPRFDPRWYGERVRGLSGNPLVHYLTQGRAQGIEIPALDAAPLHDHPDVLEIVNNPLFDADWYRARCPGLPKGRETVAQHYLTTGWLEGFQPGPLFDGDAYLKRYEDVREAGANPLLHYLRHGHGERREAFAVQGDGRRSAGPDHSRPYEQATRSNLFDTAPGPAHADDATTDPWIWLRADDFGEPDEGHLEVRLGDLVIGRTRAPMADLDATLETFARLAGLAAFDENATKPSFETGSTRLVRDAWFLTNLDLRIRLALPQGIACVVRAYQVSLDGRGLRRLEEAAFDPSAVTIIDLSLMNPFSPVLLCVDDGYGILVGASILCFPSLARGGLHHGELLAADAQDDLSGHDADLATQWLDATAGPLAISALEVDMDSVIGGEAIFGPCLQTWLKAAMRLMVTQHLQVDAGIVGPDVTEFGPERTAGDGATLIVPGDGVPTIAALVSRSPSVATANGPWPVILADTVRSRPRWHVTPPEGLDFLSDLQPRTGGHPWPVLRGRHAPDSAQGETGARPPLAIRFRENAEAVHERVSVFPVAPDRPGPLLKQAATARPGRVTVVLNLNAATGMDALAATVGSLATQVRAGTLDVIIASPVLNEDALALTRHHFPDALHIVDPSSSAARWNKGAAKARGRFLLLVEAGMVLHDPRTVETLLTIARTAGVASVGCATIQTASRADIGRKLSLHSAGVFPEQIAFRMGPQLMLGEPTTAAAMAPASYAVAANLFRLTLIPRAAWNALNGLDASTCPETDYDLDFGMRALKLGMVHVCTTVVAATRLGGMPLGRSQALSRARLSMPDWAAALAKMTIVRALG